MHIPFGRHIGRIYIRLCTRFIKSGIKCVTQADFSWFEYYYTTFLLTAPNVFINSKCSLSWGLSIKIPNFGAEITSHVHKWTKI
jgi:hypothetical protein